MNGCKPVSNMRIGMMQVTFEEFVSLYGCSDADFERIVTEQSDNATPPVQVMTNTTKTLKLLVLAHPLLHRLLHPHRHLTHYAHSPSPPGCNILLFIGLDLRSPCPFSFFVCTISI